MEPNSANYYTQMSNLEEEIIVLSRLLQKAENDWKEIKEMTEMYKGQPFRVISRDDARKIKPLLGKNPAEMSIQHLRQLIAERKKEVEILKSWGKKVFDRHEELALIHKENNDAFEQSKQEFEQRVKEMLEKDELHTALKEMVKRLNKTYAVPTFAYSARGIEGRKEDYVATVRVRDGFVPVRLTYADSPKEPLRDSYVLYWLYDKQKNTVSDETVHLDTTHGLNLPVGIGKTDSQGFLRKTLMHDHNEFYIDRKTDDNKKEVTITVVHKPWYETLNFTQFESDYRKKYPETVIKQIYGNTFPDNGNDTLSLIDYYATDKTSVRIRQQFNFDTEFDFITSKSDSGINVFETQEQVSVQYFDPAATYGFMVYPVNRGAFKIKNILSLTDVNTPVVDGGNQHTFATRSTPPEHDPSGQTVNALEIHCTIGEWDKRIETLVADIHHQLELYDFALKPHSRMQEKVRNMIQLANFSNEFPYSVVGDVNKEELFKLEEYLTLFDQCIELQKTAPEQANKSGIGDILHDINTKAEILWKLLQSPYLRAELELYLGTCEKALNENPDTDPYQVSPAFEMEPYWWHIFHTLEKAYALLAKTSLAPTVWENDILPGLVKIADGDEVLGVEPSAKKVKDLIDEELSFKERLPGIKEKIGQQLNVQDHSLLKSIFSYTKTAKTVFSLGANTPGPNSPLQVILDCYGNYVAKLIVDKRPSSIFHMKLCIGILNLFNVFGSKKIDKELSDLLFIAAARKGNLKKAHILVKKEWFKEFSETCYSKAGSAGKEYAAKFLKTSLAIINLVLLTEQLIKRFEESDDFHMQMSALEFTGLTLNFVQTAGEGAMCVHTTRMLLGKWRSVFDANEKHMLKFVAGEADRLAVFLGVLSTTIALIDAFQANEDDNTELCIKKTIEAAGSFMTTMGYVMISAAKKQGVKSALVKIAATLGVRAASTAWVPVVGQFLLVGGTIITVLQIAYEFGYPYVATRVERKINPVYMRIKDFWDEIEKLNASLNNLYSDKDSGIDPAIADLYNAIDEKKKKTFKLVSDHGVQWGKMSWRAIIPLHEAGYPVEAIREMVIMVRGGTSVDDVIQLYESAKNNPGKEYPQGHTNGTIARLLKEGDYTPDRKNPEDEIWNHEYFFYKKAFMGLRKLIDEAFLEKYSQHSHYGG